MNQARNKIQAPVLDQSRALTMYLDALFREPPATQATEVEQAVENVSGLIEPKVATEDSWKDGPFKAVLMKIADLVLAMPLAEINGIARRPETLTRLPEKPAWQLGLGETRQHQYQLVDTAKLILSRKDKADSADEKHGYVVIVGDGRWGLQCQCASHVITLQPDEVRWSGQSVKRPWLAGLVKEHLCALVDIEEMVDWLDEGARIPG